MKILNQAITIDELRTMAAQTFGNMIKAVVDVDKKMLAIDAELHSDLEELLLEHDSKQKDLWGINLYPDLEGENFIEFDSMINMRPSQGNKSRGVDDMKIQQKIIETLNEWVKR